MTHLETIGEARRRADVRARCTDPGPMTGPWHAPGQAALGELRAAVAEHAQALGVDGYRLTLSPTPAWLEVRARFEGATHRVWLTWGSPPGAAAATTRVRDALDAMAGWPHRRDLAWVDVETTGGKAGWHEVVEVGVVRTTADGDELGRYSTLIRAEHLDRANPHAMRVHGIRPAALRVAPGAATIRPVLARVLDGARLAGHGVSFDQRHLAALYAGDPPWAEAAPVDTLEVGRELKRRGVISSASLGRVAGHYEVDPGRAHRALDDAATALACWRAHRSQTQGR